MYKYICALVLLYISFDLLLSATVLTFILKVVRVCVCVCFSEKI